MPSIDTSTDRGKHAEQRLRQDLIGWLTTVTPSGQPESVPVWFLWEEGGTVLIYSQPNKPKIRNINQNPRVAFAVDDTKGGGDVIRMEGTAEIVEGYPLAHEVPDYLAKYDGPIQYIGYDAESFAKAYSVAIRVTPAKLRY
jgi:PPOX class probable F420-dependent enzyme